MNAANTPSVCSNRRGNSNLKVRNGHHAAQPSTGNSMKHANTGMIWMARITALLTRPLSAKSEDSVHERGRYLLKILGCNDCPPLAMHRAGELYQKKYWLTDDSLSWQGPWSTTYPYMQAISEEQWLAQARLRQDGPQPI